MFWEKKLTNWVQEIRRVSAIPLRLELWNGSQFDFSDGVPQVTLRVPNVAALTYLFKPSLSNLGEAYVEGKIDVEGPLGSIVSVANALAAKTLKAEGKLGRHAVARGSQPGA